MSDAVLPWAKRQRDDWIRSVERMLAGDLRVIDNGRDITEGWTAFLLGKIDEADALVAKLEERAA